MRAARLVMALWLNMVLGPTSRPGAQPYGDSIMGGLAVATMLTLVFLSALCGLVPYQRADATTDRSRRSFRPVSGYLHN
jgi:hypothetical protein